MIQRGKLYACFNIHWGIRRWNLELLDKTDTKASKQKAEKQTNFPHNDQDSIDLKSVFSGFGDVTGGLFFVQWTFEMKF